MKLIEEVKERARKSIKTIILPEAEDIRILEATQTILKEKFANIILIGKEEEILKKVKENNLDIANAEIINPETSAKRKEY